MNVMIIGADGRAHAFARKLSESPRCENIYIAPGNPGTATVGTNLPIDTKNFDGLAAAIEEHDISLVIVGPEEPLVLGITDYLKADPRSGHAMVIGPGKAAAQLEGSKAFAKDFMKRHGIPTAKSKEFTRAEYDEGLAYLATHSLPVVLKADGLAAGKGVLICASALEARAEFELMLMQSKFGEAGNKVVVEEFLPGIEMSVFVLTDGSDYVLLPEAKDYKRAGEGDTGLNTGGMGAVSPVPFMNEVLKNRIIESIIQPTIHGLQTDGLDYIGFIFIGLMIHENHARVVEYNCRMGDPETEVVLPRIKNDFVDLLEATAGSNLGGLTVTVAEQTAVAIVAVSGGYPGDYEKGLAISGLAKNGGSAYILQSGTALKDGQIVTSGGRVLVSVGFGSSIASAAAAADEGLQPIHFEGMNFRSDIGYEFF